MSKPIIGYTEQWEAKTFYSAVSTGTFRVLKLGSDYYLFEQYINNAVYKYNSSNDTWQKYALTWPVIESFGISGLWTDGTSIYYSNINSSSNVQLVLNMTTLEWSQITWGNVSIKAGRNIWYDDIHNTVMYIERGVVKSWINRNYNNWADTALNGWTASDQDEVTGADFWCDRVTGDWYASSAFANYKLASGSDTWVKVWTSGFNPKKGSDVWSDGTNIYYSDSTRSDGQLVYDRTQDKWSAKTWTGPLTDFDGWNIVSVPGHTYYCRDTVYEFNSTQDAFEESYITLTNYFSISGANVWTDGDNTYYNDDYVFNKATSTWSAKTWNGSTGFSGYNIWTDGTNIYYSSGSEHYVLDKATSTWSVKTWNGLASFSGYSIWSDGTNIYYSDGSNQYVLDKATDTWSVKTWNGLTSFNGQDIWTDGVNIYYSHYNSQYVLDKATDTWSVKTWSSQPSHFYGNNVWSDGIDIYYSADTEQYVFDKTTGAWSVKTWDGLNDFSGQNVWVDTDGDIYFSSQYALVKEPIYGKELPKYLNEEGLGHVASKLKQVAIFETRTALDAALANHELADYTIVMVRNDKL